MDAIFPHQMLYAAGIAALVYGGFILLELGIKAFTNFLID